MLVHGSALLMRTLCPASSHLCHNHDHAGCLLQASCSSLRLSSMTTAPTCTWGTR